MNPASATPDFLREMAASSRQRLDTAAARQSLAALRVAAEKAPAAPALCLSPDGFDLIAEIKKRSPAAGGLAGRDLDVAAQAEACRQGGAAALSVLTEPARFDGSLDDLTAVSAAVTTLPVMRKDFLVAPYQVLEARAAGAGGVLLIAAILDESELRDMLQLAHELGMFTLVEAFDADDLDHCVPIMQDCGPAIVAGGCRMLMGINCRNLRTLEVDFQRFGELFASLPADFPGVAESGIVESTQAADVAALGYRLALVGTALMRSGDPSAATGALIGAGRAAVSETRP